MVKIFHMMGELNMAKIKVGINGVGRIGRTLIRQMVTSPSDQIELVAVNNPGDAKTYTHLIKYDSVHQTLPMKVALEGDFSKLIINKLNFLLKETQLKLTGPN